MRLNGVDKTLTREEALRLHREMWTDMQKTLGDDPEPSFREKFKRDWIRNHGYDDVTNDCFLCEYSFDGTLTHCSGCPIEWGYLCASLDDPEFGYCYADYSEYDGDTQIYLFAPISEILRLPERRR